MMPGSMSVSLLVLAAVCGAWSTSLAASEDPVPPCKYFPGGVVAAGTVVGNCGLNPEFVAKYPPFTPYAQSEDLRVRMETACAKHNLTSGTQEAYDACSNDQDNYCFISGGPPLPWSCNSMSKSALNQNTALGALTDLGVPCPGSLFEAYAACQSTPDADCKGDCVLRLDLFGNVTRLQERRKVVGPGYLQYYFCYPQAINESLSSPYDVNYLIFSNDPANFTKIYGECDFAKQKFKRDAYTRLCHPRGKFSTKVGGLMQGTGSIYDYSPDGNAFNLTGIDHHLAVKCLLAGCDLNFIPDSPGYGKGVDLFQCIPNLDTRSQLGIYDPSEDKELVAAVRICSDPRVRWNQELCGNATLAGGVPVSV